MYLCPTDCQGLPRYASLKFRFVQGSVRVASQMSPMNAKVWQSMLRSSFDSFRVRSGRFKSGRIKFALSPIASLRSPIASHKVRSACCRNAKVCLLLMPLTAHAAYCYCSPPPLLFLRIRSECLWSRCLTSFDDDLQSQADLLSTRPQAYRSLAHHLEPTYVSGQQSMGKARIQKDADMS